jgi:hypothetical protein
MEKARFCKGQRTFVSDDNDKDTRGQVYPFRPGRDGSGPPDELPRRLAAILAADIAGYSRLIVMVKSINTPLYFATGFIAMWRNSWSGWSR